jgi:hypothetical protein
MSRFIVTMLAAIAAVAGALTLALGGSVALAATPATPAASVSWHKISLINGWESSQPDYQTGNPSWAVKSGIVFLSGSVHQTGGTSNEFAVLPPAARPAHVLHITIYTQYGTSGSLDILTDGEVRAYGYGADGYASLAGVSYPAHGTRLHKLTLVNGWQSSQSQYDTADPSYTIEAGEVYLSGSMHSPGSGGRFAALPRAARPAHLTYIPVYTNSGTTGWLIAYPSGEIVALGNASQAFTSLAGVSYPQARATRHVLTLKNGWRSCLARCRTGKPSFRVAGGVVYLSGGMFQPGSVPAKEQFGVLPRWARPFHTLYIQDYTVNGSLGTIQIKPNGTMWADGSPFSQAQSFTSLEGISFPVSS